MLKYQFLGSSGLRVSELSLGTMTFGDELGWGASRDESRRIFEHFVSLGGNFVDTANGYTNGVSERLIGEFVGADRDKFVLATKYSFPTSAGDPNNGGNHRKSMARSLERSLDRLATDYVDLFWVHAWDFSTSVEEVMRGLDDLVSAGKVLYVGISNAPAWIVSRANMLADVRGWTPFVALQLEYNLVERTSERELLPMARALGLTVTSWSPLSGGVLTGKYNDVQTPIATTSEIAGSGTNEMRLSVVSRERVNDRSLAIAHTVRGVARELGATPAQVALAWLRSRRGAIIPIIGARRLDQAKENFACIDLQLDERQLERLDDVSRVELGFPHQFLGDPLLKARITGGTHGRLLEHRDP
jgi:aryl-alcohol dehydrogenase-like predicted oxidoreductase